MESTISVYEYLQTELTNRARDRAAAKQAAALLLVALQFICTLSKKESNMLPWGNRPLLWRLSCRLRCKLPLEARSGHPVEI